MSHRCSFSWSETLLPEATRGTGLVHFRVKGIAQHLLREHRVMLPARPLPQEQLAGVWGLSGLFLPAAGTVLRGCERRDPAPEVHRRV